MSKAPYTMFNRTLDVRVITYTEGKLDEPARESWFDTIWVERGEDMYALMCPQFRDKTIRIVYREDWLQARYDAEFYDTIT